MNGPITGWNPLKEMGGLQNRQSTSFPRPSTWSYAGKDTAFKMPQWAPLVDIIEDHSEYLIKAELPEIHSKDVKVTVQNGVLTVSGQRVLDEEKKKHTTVSSAPTGRSHAVLHSPKQ
jgi:HSP20 family protein